MAPWAQANYPHVRHIRGDRGEMVPRRAGSVANLAEIDLHVLSWWEWLTLAHAAGRLLRI